MKRRKGEKEKRRIGEHSGFEKAGIENYYEN
jgi:hypothetical protein